MVENLKKRYQKFADEQKSSEAMFQDFQYAWRHNGQFPDGQSFKMLDAYEFTLKDKDFHDAVNVSDFPMFIPRVITNIVREAREPILVGEKLLQRLDYTPGQVVNLGAMGALSGDFDVPEMGELPVAQVQWGEGTQIRSTGKQGAALKFSKDIIQYSAFPVIELHTRALARAMARFKEEKIFSTITRLGRVAFDNVNVGEDDSLFGVTTGRDLKGDPNGSFTMDDLMKMMIQVIHNGYMPDTLLMHTLTWLMWLQDPVFKMFALQNGGGFFYGSYTGNALETNDWPNMRGLGIGEGRFFDPTSSNAEKAFITTDAKAQVPSYFNFGPKLNIVVTPFLPYDAETNRTDIMLFDSRELGYLVVGQDMQVMDWTDPRDDIYTVKMTEKYSIAIENEGQAVSTAKSVQVSPGNQIVLPARTVIQVDGEVKDVPPRVSPFTDEES